MEDIIQILEGEKGRGGVGERLREKARTRGSPSPPLVPAQSSFTRYANSSGRVLKLSRPPSISIFDRADHGALGVYGVYAAHGRPLAVHFRQVQGERKSVTVGQRRNEHLFGPHLAAERPGGGCRAEIDGPPGHVESASRRWPDIAGVQVHTGHRALAPRMVSRPMR